jgi:AbrB family looped-hinge helix DNA binding protein
MVKTIKLGAKRSLYIPKRTGNLLSIAPGSRLEMRVENGEIILTPVVDSSHSLPAPVRAKFLARRERTTAGLNLEEFSARVLANATKAPTSKGRAAASKGLVAGEEMRTA